MIFILTEVLSYLQNLTKLNLLSTGITIKKAAAGIWTGLSFELIAGSISVFENYKNFNIGPCFVLVSLSLHLSKISPKIYPAL